MAIITKRRKPVLRVVSLRLSLKMIQKLDQAADLYEENRSDYVRRVVEKALKKERLTEIC